MITSNVFERVFQLKWQNNVCSCFTMEHEGKQYICTARHCVEKFMSGDRIEIFHDGKWKYTPARLIGLGSDGADISVLAISTALSAPRPITLKEGGIGYGQEVYFLGFPYGIRWGAGNLNRVFPMPFVKKGILSGSIGESLCVHLIDGHNNPGFSGGPVVYQHTINPELAAQHRFGLLGVVSGYQYDDEPVLDGRGNETDLRYRTNTGIVYAHDIKHAIDAIEQKPNGHVL